ncbi:MAG: hypothetical protein KJ041_02005 [Gammaproteobacteria bacterium]|nr:hypothetical protein [Gammaproteobacteria bacterium]
MATLTELQTRRRELEARLYEGDLSVEPALERVDRAIASRTLKVQHSRQRLEAVKEAVAAGVNKDDARRIRTQATTKKLVELRAKAKVNRH